jgi:hypothetical protein
MHGYESKNIFEEGNITIENNTVKNVIRGFSLYKNSYGEKLGEKNLNVRIENNLFTATGQTGDHKTSGVFLPRFTAGFKIKGNTFTDFKTGVSLADDTGLMAIDGNNFKNCGTEIIRKQ